jgi:hypothetical protein
VVSTAKIPQDIRLEQQAAEDLYEAVGILRTDDLEAAMGVLNV